LAVRHGPKLDAWWDALPQRTAALAERWSLQLLKPIPRGNTSLLVRCRRDDGRAGILKLTPDPALAADESRALRAWEPTGRVPAVWEHDDEAFAAMVDHLTTYRQSANWSGPILG